MLYATNNAGVDDPLDRASNELTLHSSNKSDHPSNQFQIAHPKAFVDVSFNPSMARNMATIGVFLKE